MQTLFSDTPINQDKLLIVCAHVCSLGVSANGDFLRDNFYILSIFSLSLFFLGGGGVGVLNGNLWIILTISYL